MQPLNLPQDLITFLRERRELIYSAADCEVGKVVLEWLEDLELSAAEAHVADEDHFADDPHHGEDGHYSIPCVSLLLDCEGYLPWGVLCWFPAERQFGTVDSDHGRILLFGPNVGWRDIERDPARWLSLQWRAEQPKCFQPQGRYPFVPTVAESRGLEQTLQEVRARLARLEAKCERRGIVGGTNHATFIRDEIAAFESWHKQKASLKQSPVESKVRKPTEDSALLQADMGSVPESFADLLAAQLSALEEMFAKAPASQREQLQAKMDAIRKQVGGSGDK